MMETLIDVPREHASGRKISTTRDSHKQVATKGVFSNGRTSNSSDSNGKTLSLPSDRDPLTNLHSLRQLPDRLAQAMLLARRSGSLTAICHLDIDGFKAVNDQFGHSVGDQLLIVIAERLKQSVRAFDTVVRIGGDDFVLVLCEIESLPTLNSILDRITETVAHEVELEEFSVCLQVTASTGVAIYPHDGEDHADLLHRANRAMHLAKNSGGATWRIFDAQQHRFLSRRRRALEELRDALTHDQFRLYYQPKVWLESGRIAGVEALLRWQHPQRGLLQPADFLPTLEGSDLTSLVDLWVIDKAFAQAAQWKKKGISLPVSLNISAALLKQPKLDSQVAAAMERYPDLEPRDIEFEILESMELDDFDIATRNIMACIRLGISFSIDDFGTGYSSLTYLKRLPAMAIKIDRSFIATMATNQEDFAIVSGILGMAAALDRRVIAEGVETPTMGRLLGNLGCDIVQGYGICHPLPAEQITSWAANFQLGPEWSPRLEK